MGNIFSDSVGPSLQNMLTLNQTIVEYLPIDSASDFISSSIVSFLTIGLSCHNSLQGLCVKIPLSSYYESVEERTRPFLMSSLKRTTSQKLKCTS